MSRMSISRRGFLGAVAVGGVVGGCSGAADGGAGADRPGEEAAERAPTEFREAPMLAERVQAGDLPPVDERLPKEPYVVRPGVLVAEEFIEPRPGEYGGTFQMAQEGPNGDPVIFIGLNEPLLWAPNGFEFDQGIEGNVLAGYEVNSDNTEFVLHMREGLRWSDGEPGTIEDVRFAFEDVLYNEEITPTFPLYLRAGLRSDAAPAELTVIDDWTFSLTFDQPYGTFLAQIAIASWRGYGGMIKPRHYLEQFHEKYASRQRLNELVREESVPDGQWFTLFDNKQLTDWMWDITTEASIDHPTLNAWILTRADTGVFNYERNPYYFKVDVEGNQLPYMDGIRSQVVADYETLTSRALFGEFDYLGERATIRQLPLIAEKADTGEINMFVPSQWLAPLTVFLNLTYEDDAWRAVVRDARFRRAMSLALNRREVIENFYLGEFAELPEETNSGDYDTDEAERLLDEIGLDQRDADGNRLGPNGDRFTIPFELAAHTEMHIPVAELIAEHWKAVGIFTTVKQLDGTLYGERRTGNQLQAHMIWHHAPIWGPGSFTDYLPSGLWAPLWGLWYETQGEDGEEPPDEVKELFEHHGELMSAPVGSPESQAAVEAIKKNHYDNTWTIDPVGKAYFPTFWSSRVKNVPLGVKKDVYGIIVTYSMEQWYIDE